MCLSTTHCLDLYVGILFLFLSLFCGSIFPLIFTLYGFHNRNLLVTRALLESHNPYPNLCCFNLIVGSGLSTTMLCNVAPVIFISCLLAASTLIPRGTPLFTIYDYYTSLSTDLALSVGFAPVHFFSQEVPL